MNTDEAQLIKLTKILKEQFRTYPNDENSSRIQHKFFLPKEGGSNDGYDIVCVCSNSDHIQMNEIGKRKDQKAHGEYLYLTEHYKDENGSETTLYSSLEPCHHVCSPEITSKKSITKVVWLMDDKGQFGKYKRKRGIETHPHQCGTNIISQILNSGWKYFQILYFDLSCLLFVQCICISGFSFWKRD